MIDTLHKLYSHEISDLLNSEGQMLVALPQMAAEANDKKLSKAFDEHLKETYHHVVRLKTILENHEEVYFDTGGESVKGLLREASKLSLKLSGEAVDPGLIGLAQKVGHYEIASYGTLIEYAKQLNYEDDLVLLGKSIKEEGDYNERLTLIATGGLFRSGANSDAIAL